jgi:hypothetical protein
VYRATRIKQSKLNHAIPAVLRPILDNQPVTLAGGAGRRFFGEQETADYDFFFVAAEDKLKSKDEISGYLITVGFKKIFQCEKDELRSFSNEEGMKVQLIDIEGKEYSSPEAVLDSFDLNAGRFAYYKGSVYFDRAALRDFRGKHVSLHRLTYPAATIKRLGKYLGKNYKIYNGSLDFVRMLTEMVQRGEEISDLVYID